MFLRPLIYLKVSTMCSAGRYGSDINRLMYFLWQSSCLDINYNVTFINKHIKN